MTILASDDFAGDGALSGNWTQVIFSGTGTSSRVSGQLSSPVTIAEWYLWTALSWPNDQMARMTYISGSDGADQGTGPAVRMVGAGASSTGYLLQVGATDTRLYEKSAGAFTQLGTTDSTVPSNGDVFEISAIGTTITVKRNGSNICSTPVTDSAHASGTAAFWAAAQNSATLRDNWDGADSGGFNVGARPNAQIKNHRPRPFAPGIAR